MREVTIVIPAAGESRRFKEAGYTTPKPFLRIQDRCNVTKSMVAHVVDSYPGYRAVVGIPSNWELPEDVKYAQAVKIDHTRGQADTVFQILNRGNIDPSSPILVMDCDMRLSFFAIDEIVKSLNYFSVAVAVTETLDPNASRVDKVPFPEKFTEKEPISVWGIVGVRGFHKIEQLHLALFRYLSRETKEPYLTPAINSIFGPKFAYVVPEYEDWGTPERLADSGAKILR